MKNLKLIQLVEKELLNIKGGDSGNPVACSCDCGGGDTTYQQSFGNISGATLAGNNNPPIK